MRDRRKQIWEVTVVVCETEGIAGFTDKKGIREMILQKVTSGQSPLPTYLKVVSTYAEPTGDPYFEDEVGF